MRISRSAKMKTLNTNPSNTTQRKQLLQTKFILISHPLINNKSFIPDKRQPEECLLNFLRLESDPKSN